MYLLQIEKRLIYSLRLNLQ